MIFDLLGQFVQKVTDGIGTSVGAAQLADLISSTLTNEQALSFAKAQCRETYEKRVLPASYDHVVENLRLSKSDILDYFQQGRTDGRTPLSDFLKRCLSGRMSSWVQNRPDEAVVNALIDDFYSAYQAYLVNADATVTGLHTLANTQELLNLSKALVNYLVDESSQAPDPQRSQSLSANDVVHYLNFLGIPVEILDMRDRQADLLITDVSGILITRTFLVCCNTAPDSTTLDAVSQRASNAGRIAHVLFLSGQDVGADLRSYAERIGIQILSMCEFRRLFARAVKAPKYVLGTLAMSDLMESFNVHDVYVEPHGVLIEQGGAENIENSNVRIPLRGMIEGFLDIQAEDWKTLVLLGGYGAGKSSVCARLAHEYSRSATSCYFPVVLPLGALQQGDDLGQMAITAERAAVTLSEGRKALLILDGVDELFDALHANQRQQNFLRLRQLALDCYPETKIIVTARNSYFRGMTDFWKLVERPMEGNLWDVLAPWLRNGAAKPRIAAIQLRDFNNDQIREYLDKVAVQRGLGPQFADEFLAGMERHDKQGFFRFMTRNPLYMFVTVNSRPWEHESVACLADAVEHYLNYWLERDFMKGSSRWIFATDEKKAFLSQVAWYLQAQHSLYLTLDELDAQVREFLDYREDDAEIFALVSALRTTGTFLASGSRLGFANPLFMDFLIAESLATGELPDASVPMPSKGQGELWLGMAETRQMPLKFPVSRIEPPIATSDERLDVDTTGILFGEERCRRGWQFVNSPRNAGLRQVLRAVLQSPRSDTDLSVQVKVVNRLGLHARSSAKFVEIVRQWLGEQDHHEAAVLLARDGHQFDATGIMDIMMVAAARGCEIEIIAKNTTEKEFRRLLKGLRCRPTDTPGHWDGDFKHDGRWYLD